ncbi:MAG: acetyl-CoA hydrolase/transferase family protein [Paludibacteraceae bacterium]|nr:acetyl-CoA hydrolase/transferase family protein [Paludibacteraceae bacterium]
MAYNFMSADEAARLIKNGDVVATSGFTASGAPKELPTAIARYADEEHKAGREFQISLFSGASTGDSCDGELSRAHAMKFRTPYQSSKDLRKAINSGEVNYIDAHLSQLAQELRYGTYGKINVAILEAADLSANGDILLTAGVGNSATYANLAEKIIVEINDMHPKSILGIHDLYEPADPPYRKEIPIYSVKDRIGKETLKVDPEKIIAVVNTSRPNEVGKFTPVDETTQKIGENVAKFLSSQLKCGFIPKSFLPIQSGVGNVANAVLGLLGDDPDIPNFTMYTEVIQDAVIDLMKKGRVSFASGSSLTVTEETLRDVYGNLDAFRDKLILRPIEISNNPEVVRRLGLITLNTALEADIYGNINSTHVMGTKMMNGIGGSGDFTRNAYISVYSCPSIQKGGCISPIVPMVSHVDHSEHSVKVLITDQGIADLRGLAPRERVKCIIENCVHPDYKQLMWDYLKLTDSKLQTPHNLRAAFAFHNAFNETGDMRNIDWSKYE